MISEVKRRTMAGRWIASLDPLIQVVQNKANSLGLGATMIPNEPRWFPRRFFEDTAGDRVRKGAVWWVKGLGNCGFHVDFCSNGATHIEAWTGAERRTSTWISGKVTEQTLRRDLSVCLVAAGLTDLARTEEVRDALFSRTKKK